MNEEPQFDWAEVVNRNPQGYCEIQDLIAGIVFHGPVENVTIDKEDMVTIRLKWVAQMPLPGREGFGKWKKVDDKYGAISFPNFMNPFVIDEIPQKGPRVRFGGYQIIYINPQRGIDPSQVEGL